MHYFLSKWTAKLQKIFLPVYLKGQNHKKVQIFQMRVP